MQSPTAALPRAVQSERPGAAGETRAPCDLSRNDAPGADVNRLTQLLELLSLVIDAREQLLELGLEGASVCSVLELLTQLLGQHDQRKGLGLAAPRDTRHFYVIVGVDEVLESYAETRVSTRSSQRRAPLTVKATLTVPR